MASISGSSPGMTLGASCAGVTEVLAGSWCPGDGCGSAKVPSWCLCWSGAWGRATSEAASSRLVTCHPDWGSGLKAPNSFGVSPSLLEVSALWWHLAAGLAGDAVLSPPRTLSILWDQRSPRKGHCGCCPHTHPLHVAPAGPRSGCPAPRGSVVRCFPQQPLAVIFLSPGSRQRAFPASPPCTIALL